MDSSAWDEITAQWRERAFDRLREEVSKLDGSRVKRVDDLIDGKLDPADGDAVIADALAAAASHPQGAVLMAVYVYARCLEMWERSADYPHIRGVLHALRAEASELLASSPSRGAAEAELLDVAVDQAQHMVDAMAVENALQCSCPVATWEHASKIVDRVDRLMERMPSGDGGGPLDLLRADAEVTGIYFKQVRDLANAVSEMIDHVEQGEPEKGRFDAVVGALREAERAPALHGDVYQSELRTHVATAQALNGSLREAWIRIGLAELVYVYPFALEGEGAAAAEVIERAEAGALSWILGPGVTPADVGPTRLSDRWEHADPPERTHGGVSIHLPRIQVEPTALKPLLEHFEYELEMLEFTAEVRLSRLGNHYLRVGSVLKDATLHDLNQALRRASPGMGDEKVLCPGGTWDRFVSPDEDAPGYVDDMIAGVAANLGAAVVGDPTSDFHIGLGIREATVPGREDEGVPPLAEELEGAVGASLLFHSVGDCATSLEEWVRYPAPRVENLMEGSGRVGDLVMRTPDTTVLYMPTSPEWLCGEYEEMIEFVASLPPLLTLWEKRIRTRADSLERALAELRDPAADPSEKLGQIHRDEAALHELQAEIRRELADLHSPRLVDSRRTRAFLDRLWEAAGLPALESGLERQLAISSTLQERLAAMASGIAEDNRQREELLRRRAEERQQRLQRFVEAGLGVIAATSLAGLFEWLNGGFELQGRALVWLEAGLLVGAAVTLTAIILRARR
ncbi:MAG TPA: hypothetical protein VF715_02910 [Thermoleophilaceae bacterium]|jgi:hypothetical protein